MSPLLLWSTPNEHGQEGLVVISCVFLVSHSHPFLGASPDGVCGP